MISSRLVIFFPGFEPMRIGQHARRFERAARAAAPLYGADLSVNASHTAGEPRSAVLDCALSGAGYHTRTRVVMLDWGDIIFSYAAQPSTVRLAFGLLGLADFVVTGTVWRYARTSWRYVFFFLYPVVAFALALLAGWLAFRLGLNAPAFADLAALVLGASAFLAVLVLFDRRYHLMTALDDWALARDLCRGRSATMKRRIALQAEWVRAEAAESQAEEVVVAAHSLGACLAVEALARALKDRPADARRKLTALTVGSSLMKTALHPAANTQRAAVAALLERDDLRWIDVQSLQDPINFYKSDPAGSLGLPAAHPPVVVRAHFKNGVTRETYRRIKRNFFRLHRQFVLPVEVRAPFSFHMLLLGPNPMERFADLKRIDVPPLAPEEEPSKGKGA